MNHCRDAIYLALKALQLPKGAPVGLTLFNCQTVMSAVVAADCTPIFLDITSEYFLDQGDLQRKHAANELQALIVTHLFGNINDVNEIQQLVPNIPIIEDCAHAWDYFASNLHLSTFNIGSARVPTRVEDSILVASLGLGKCLNLGPGGLLFTENERYIVDVNSIYEDLPQMAKFHNFILKFTLPIKRVFYRSFLPNIALWRCSRNFRHRRLSPWQPPCRMSLTVKQSFLNYQRSTLYHQPSKLLLRPSYHNCFFWASQLGVTTPDCPNTKSLISPIIHR